MFTIPNGVYPTMITPYTKDNEVDYENVKRIASWYIQKGCEGIFSVCQSSEMFYLSLDERVNIAKTVKNTAGPNVCVVASGHTGSSIEEQAYELNAMAETGVDGIVLVSNRLDMHNDGDTVWIKNAEKLLSKIKSDIPLGIYECPHPYKKLLSSAILNWMKETNRFVFIKDTCCSPNLLKQRLELLRGSGIKLYKNPDHPYAEKVQTFLSLYAFTEALPYPLTAKYRMSLEGIPVNLESRMVDKKRWDDFAKFMIHQLLDIEKETIEYIKKMDSKSI